MFETSVPSTTKVEKINNDADCCVEIEDIESDQDSSLWCIEDDSLFSAEGLKHHSAGKGKSVYVTWNESYLLNFVFKTSSRTGTTTLTKVRISMPVHDQQHEEISNILILEMNTLLYMKSGRVYYFSSVKSMHKVDWLIGVRCMTSCPLTQFSVIRLLNTFHDDNHEQKKILSLEVYKDVPQLGKCSGNDVLRHIYDITFDFENIFNCDWVDETYTLTSLISDQSNFLFLKQLVTIGNIFCSQQESMDLILNQEVHIFTISGNIFVLVGAIVTESEFKPSNPQIENFSIRLLNTYACPIECIRIDCENNLLMVLMQSGHLDIWYKSKRMFGALLHCQHEVSHFSDYDYWPEKHIFYFTTSEEVLQLQIITHNSINVEEECVVKETRKYVGGMTACTFVEGLQQLICLSFNNIFYRINFTTPPQIMEMANKNESNFENLNILYALNAKRINDLTAKALIVDELIEQPKYLHNAIEKEFKKQQILAIQSKIDIFKKFFQCHLEYHACLPGKEYFDKDYVHIKTSSYSNKKISIQSIFCLIFISLKNNTNNLLSSIFTSIMWYLNISYLEQCLHLHIPYEMLKNKLCFIFDIPLEDHVKQTLPKFSLDLLTFLNHQSCTICLKYNLSLLTDENTYLNLFSYNIQNLQIFQNSFDVVKHLLCTQSKLTDSKNTVKCDEIGFKFKQRYKIPKSVLYHIMEKLNAKLSWTLGMDFKIYYLQQYLIEMNYDDSVDILLMCSNYPMAIFYMKLLLINAIPSCADFDIVETACNNMQKIVMNYQSDIERLYGSIMSLESDDLNSNTISMNVENLRNVYFKLRSEIYDVLR